MIVTREPSARENGAGFTAQVQLRRRHEVGGAGQVRKYVQRWFGDRAGVTPAEHAAAEVPVADKIHPLFDLVCVVESAQVRVRVENVGGPQLDVVQTDLVNECLSAPDLGGGQVDADATGLRIPPGQRNQVAAGGASQFQDSGPIRWDRVQTEQSAEHRQVLGAGVGEGVALVVKLIVGVHGVSPGSSGRRAAITPKGRAS